MSNFHNYIFLGEVNKAVNELKTGWEKINKNFNMQIEETYNMQGIYWSL